MLKKITIHTSKGNTKAAIATLSPEAKKPMHKMPELMN